MKNKNKSFLGNETKTAAMTKWMKWPEELDVGSIPAMSNSPPLGKGLNGSRLDNITCSCVFHVDTKGSPIVNRRAYYSSLEEKKSIILALSL